MWHMIISSFTGYKASKSLCKCWELIKVRMEVTVKVWHLLLQFVLVGTLTAFRKWEGVVGTG